MTVLLVLTTFAVFLIVDYFLTRRQPVQVSAPAAHVPIVAPPKLEPAWVAGFQVPEALHYHRGHTWALPEEDGTVRVGLDDFARRLLGSAKEIHVPQSGAWLAQGDRGAAVRRTAARPSWSRRSRARWWRSTPPSPPAPARHRRPLRTRLAVQGAAQQPRPPTCAT